MIDHNLLVTWSSWYERNEITHEKPIPSIEGSKRFLYSYTKILDSIRDTPTDKILQGKQPVLVGAAPCAKRKVRKPSVKPWVRPPSGWVKLTIDVSYKRDNGYAGTGIVLRDDAGAVIFLSCRYLPACEEALEAEVVACSEGLELALQHSHFPIIIESDCSQLISAIISKVRDRSSHLHIISEIQVIARSSGYCNFVKVDRSQVRISHCLANRARVENLTMFWLGLVPELLRRELVPSCM
jgi:ribonuclease HI